MSGIANYPTSLDDSSSLHEVTDGTSTLQAAHHNDLRAAIEALEKVVGILGSSVPTSLQYRLGNPTGGHVHDGATGNAPKIAATAISGLSESSLKRPAYGIVEANSSPGTAPSGVNSVVGFDSFYDSEQSVASSLPTVLGLGYASGIFQASRAGIMGFNITVIPEATLSATGMVFLNNPGYAYNPAKRLGLTNDTVVGWTEHYAVPLVTGATFALMQRSFGGPQPMITYAAIDIMRLTEKFD